MDSVRTNRNCQSCGMPMKRDEKGGGTNADGTKSLLFCSHCYASGRFTMPDLTVDEMKELVTRKLKGFGFPRFIAGLFTRRIPHLQRWSDPPRQA